tara:strand:+ start:68 stop:424 length:357 start_codon:yes stop_codon:yes gene_type:complete
MIWWQLAIRGIISGGLIVSASEVAKKNDMFGALIASLPLVSIAAIIWLYNDTTDTEKVASFTTDILWLVIPSLVLFISLPILLNRGMDFWPALALACSLTIAAYLIGIKLVNQFTQTV